jgi:hypothetical protein
MLALPTQSGAADDFIDCSDGADYVVPTGKIFRALEFHIHMGWSSTDTFHLADSGQRVCVLGSCNWSTVYWCNLMHDYPAADAVEFESGSTPGGPNTGYVLGIEMDA